MAQPTLHFLYNTAANSTPYAGTGADQGTWKEMHLTTASGINPDKFIFTGGGINAGLSTPTALYGSREATLRPAAGTTIIPQTYVESHTDNIMYNVPNAGQNSNRYVFGVYIDGYIASDLYLEAWDDTNFSTIVLPVLSGTATYTDSMINAISTTNVSPPAGWTGATWSGTTYSGASNYLRGYNNRVRLAGSDSSQDETLYFNIFVELPYDAPYFYNTPVLSFRYLYI